MAVLAEGPPGAPAQRKGATLADGPCAVRAVADQPQEVQDEQPEELAFMLDLMLKPIWGWNSTEMG
jgi:hypothetical protein